MEKQLKEIKPRSYEKEFISIFNQLAYKYSDWQIWNDFLIFSSVAFSNVVKTPDWNKREEEYIMTAKKYEKEELTRFSSLLALVTEALEENPEQDFLGELYMKLELNKHQKGQFFTPYHIARFMAETQMINVDKEIIEQKGYITVNDPACGSGVLLLAFANVSKKYINYQRDVLFYAQDIDRTAALMCYIQLSLLGCPTIIIVGNSLLPEELQKEREVWYTPFYYLNATKFEQEEYNQKETAIETQNKIIITQESTEQLCLSL